MTHPDKDLHKETLWLQFEAQGVSRKDFETIFVYVKCVVIRTGHTLYKEDAVCNRVAFLIEGDLYAHYTEASGSRRISQFFHFPVDRVVLSYTSFMTGEVALEAITAVSDCILLFLTREDLNHLFNNIPSLRVLERRMIESAHSMMLKEHEETKYLSNIELLKWIYTHKPWLFKAPFKHLLVYSLRMEKNSFTMHRKALGYDNE